MTTAEQEPSPPDRERRADGRTNRSVWVGRLVLAVVLMALVAFVVRGADRPVDPYLEAGSTAGRRLIEGFDEVAFRVVAADGRVIDGCALLADDEEERARGLMDQRDLGGYDSMVFRFQEPSDGAFYMRDTIIPLTVAYFDEGGRFVSRADMQPCPDEVVTCPTYGADSRYLHALEVAAGGGGALAFAPGSTLSFPGGACPS